MLSSLDLGYLDFLLQMYEEKNNIKLFSQEKSFYYGFIFIKTSTFPDLFNTYITFRHKKELHIYRVSKTNDF